MKFGTGIRTHHFGCHPKEKRQKYADEKNLVTRRSQKENEASMGISSQSKAIHGKRRLREFKAKETNYMSVEFPAIRP